MENKCEQGFCPQVRLELGCYHPEKHCCQNCSKSRKYLIEQRPELKEFWDNEKGFWSIGGCRLPRKDVPKECKEFDCREKIFFLKIQYTQPYGWLITGRTEVELKNYEPALDLWSQFYDFLQQIKEKEKNGN